MSLTVPKERWLEVIQAYHRAVNNGRTIARLAVENTALFNAFGRDAYNTPEFKKNMETITMLNQESVAIDREFGGYIPTDGYIMPNPDWSEGIKDTSESDHA